ncbi:hypothetical protein F5B20DRAFT_592065 [Whalleya microplaca]|nr:hypothetical protein F5B20DRAFT_592065 [Whalleya microplaca]
MPIMSKRPGTQCLLPPRPGKLTLPKTPSRPELSAIINSIQDVAAVLEHHLHPLLLVGDAANYWMGCAWANRDTLDLLIRDYQVESIARDLVEQHEWTSSKATTDDREPTVGGETKVVLKQSARCDLHLKRVSRSDGSCLFLRLWSESSHGLTIDNQPLIEKASSPETGAAKPGCCFTEIIERAGSIGNVTGNVYLPTYPAFRDARAYLQKEKPFLCLVDRESKRATTPDHSKKRGASSLPSDSVEKPPAREETVHRPMPKSRKEEKGKPNLVPEPKQEKHTTPAAAPKRKRPASEEPDEPQKPVKVRKVMDTEPKGIPEPKQDKLVAPTEAPKRKRPASEEPDEPQKPVKVRKVVTTEPQDKELARGRQASAGPKKAQAKTEQKPAKKGPAASEKPLKRWICGERVEVERSESVAVPVRKPKKGSSAASSRPQKTRKQRREEDRKFLFG